MCGPAIVGEVCTVYKIVALSYDRVSVECFMSLCICIFVFHLS
jgi:hypothetical protein